MKTRLLIRGSDREPVASNNEMGVIAWVRIPSPGDERLVEVMREGDNGQPAMAVKDSQVRAGNGTPLKVHQARRRIALDVLADGRLAQVP